ncbi:MAG: hypothetical protein AAB439_02760 [Patescibacteria group bacterium]
MAEIAAAESSLIPGWVLPSGIAVALLIGIFKMTVEGDIDIDSDSKNEDTEEESKECENCGGSRFVTCGRCEGDGDDPEFFNEECWWCDGSGKVPCWECNS